MADNYTQFSEALVVKNKKELAWWRLILRAGDKSVSDHWLDNEPMTEAAKLWVPILGSENDNGYEFLWKIDEDGSQYNLWFHSDEYGNAEHVAGIVQAFFKYMRPKGRDIFTLTWADTCSSSRVGQFGGGALVVTKKRVCWLNTWDWVSQRVKRLRASK